MGEVISVVALELAQTWLGPFSVEFAPSPHVRLGFLQVFFPCDPQVKKMDS